MIERRVLLVGSLVWAVVGLSVGLGALRSTETDARFVVLAACVVGSVAALLASVSFAKRRDRLAGGLLLVSVITPTVFAWILNVPALLVGLAVLTSPVFVVRDRRILNADGTCPERLLSDDR
jgi:uncharacterized membrane protein YeaQ/YmgE (transglycosylase-associated protein family)